ncbi:macrolide ABC transporter ATP-binding protein [Candidatus Roizmanbacteria bacterium RIFOXYB2_FULL_38_10]|uniref:Macrolide ABC transporter ATP-binding protein n=1 Tax=Candidatus Roizmanbacteria bacterium RIFOXYD1_FULL_38_12 TaxID=1802093 RepID=A0A1F7KZH9_9BACT|nr:MAG: macrolide ABC transporter ATP-binding protein [Candidatus Roizmanbacteria bacterium RIFOXYA2_FULL_38_14]OGK63299.1 MAG: macrolide ABC transporter ATP-binding protein [Candidatus Roizmanbacteria bacterium RIFOXYA1_FULL_37_12]OGK65145.1 MAG: macrolide ABC transporter ATP-binding protein [Candidatus Roizmanbacteria bacterium RIFOXYB1_FULL_40_23]OGK68700.1 MAG: macrolide ABC transporter ATP-binding protein [Candidatus Roizmanbacteria bacterium RIFOXYB2_FULL_38_10]OGK69549.1 MAG: macrolide A
MTNTLLSLKKIVKSYQIKSETYHILKSLDIEIKRGDFVAIMGPSGSGKSTLLNIIGCLDSPSSGSYILEDKNVSRLSERELAVIRNIHIGFIFQNFNLISSLSVIDNVLLPSFYLGKENYKRAKELLESMGLSDRSAFKPNELSGGQKQRVAIARALMNNPSFLLADEPTGALDSKTGKEIMDLIVDLNTKQGKTILMVTHDPLIAKRAHSIIHLQDGKIVHE